MSLDDPQTAPSSAPTMQDVARLAGVSFKSVSRVINAEPHVSEKLRSKIQAAIGALGYVPDMAARSLAGQRKFTIGMLLDNASPHYTMELVAGAYQACRERRYNLQFDNLFGYGEDRSSLELVDAILRSSRTDGFILTPPLSDSPELFDALELRGIPYVRIAPVIQPGRSLAVAMDDAAAGAEVAQYLWDRGHRRFGYVGGHTSHAAVHLRGKGFIERLRQLQPDITISEAQNIFLFESGIGAGQSLLSQEPRPTAIFASNDDTAAGVMVAASQLGLKVPDDLSVVGFDDSWVAKSVWPYLTTIRQPIRAMGYAAARQLIERRSPAKAGSCTTELFDHSFVERDSVADAR